MFAAGELSDRGRRILPDGRAVRALRGDRNGATPPAQTLEYLVDAETLAPVRASVEFPPRFPQQPAFATNTIRLDIALYERLPLNAETAGLLTITPERPAEVVEREAFVNVAPRP